MIRKLQRGSGGGVRRRVVIAVLATVGALVGTAAPAAATPVATSDAEYTALGRVFPDPLAACSLAGTEPCSPNAQGNVPATQFIQIGEFVNALTYMNQRAEWRNYMEVLVLDGKINANNPSSQVPEAALDVGDTPGDAMFPGNNLPLEFNPRPQHLSAGLPTTDLARRKSDLITVRVTDETVPDAGKERYALSLSIHGIERAGIEGGTRAAEDLITAFTTGVDDEPVVPESVRPGAPTFADVLRESIIYFTYPNPDGWRRGSVTEGGAFFQRYNGNGVDLNRDWPDIGFSFRPYSGLSEPESRAFAESLTGISESTGTEFAAGDDLHGQPFADALSYTLLPHGRHEFDKNERIRDTAIAIHRASEEALLWSPIVQENEAPQGGGVPCTPTTVGEACAQIYGQTWGTVYDTINYTTTGALGDWFDSSVGLGADGIDNEMSFSHLDRNIVFEPHGEQLHVDGNKALIYAHLATILDPAQSEFVTQGINGYVRNRRLTREPKTFGQGPPPGTVAQTDVSGQTATIRPDGTTIFPFKVKRGQQPDDGSPDAGNNVFNGGLRVEITTPNLQGIATGTANLRVQCRGCDEHAGVEEENSWVTVAEDYNQALTYLQAGVTAAVNRPDPFQSDGDPVRWRAVVDGSIFDPADPAPVSSMNIDYTRTRATSDGATGGDPAPRLSGYDVASSDFFRDLNPAIPGEARDFRHIDPGAIIDGTRTLDRYRSIVLADDPLPGYTGPYGPAQAPSGPPTADFTFQGTASVPGASSGVPGTFEEFPFAIEPDDGNGSVTVRIEWAQAVNDFDMFLYRVEENGDRTLVGQSTQTQGESDFEQITVANPAAGDYVIRVDNFAAADPSYDGTVDFRPPAGDDDPSNTGRYTIAERNAWMAALRDWVAQGGNLVLTDGALRALPHLSAVGPDAVARQTVYAGQTAFATGEGEETLDDPLADDVDQEGARFGSGMRRQTFEPTPLGFAIQDAGGADQSNARQYDVDRAAWEAAGGRTAGTSVDSGDRDAAPVYDRVTLGELPRGQGQIRIAGALLPQPSQEFDHTLGLEPYATTYTGYIVMCNLLDCTIRGAP
jgi:hypothetical protein